MDKEQAQVVIVGGGFGGLAAAAQFNYAPVSVTLIDRQNHHLFQPLLYQVASASLSITEIAYPIRSVFHRQDNIEIVMAEVIEIDPLEKKVICQEGIFPYDYLILATGVQQAYFGHPEWETHAPGLKTLADALEIRQRVLRAFEQAELEPDPRRQQELLTFVVVGGGPTGVEMAGALGELACSVLQRDFRRIDPRSARVLLVEGGERILPSFSPALSSWAASALEKFCVEVLTDSLVTDIQKQAIAIGDQIIPTQTVIWAAGVQASPLFRSLTADLDRSGRILTAPDLSIPDHPQIFAVGDLAAFVHQTGSPLPGLAPVAIQQGRLAAQNILSSIQGKPRQPFRYRDRGTMATIGRGAAVAEVGGKDLRGFPAWLAWALVHILQLIGFRNRFVVLFEWAWTYLTRKRSARLITAPGDE